MAESQAERLKKIEYHLLSIDERLILVLGKLDRMMDKLSAPLAEDDDDEEEEEDISDSIEFWVVQREDGCYFKNFDSKRNKAVTTTDILTAKRFYGDKEMASGLRTLKEVCGFDGVARSVWQSELE